MQPTDDAPLPAARGRRRSFTLAMAAIAGLYMGSLWLTAVGSSLPGKVMPRSVVFFTEVAGLFTFATRAVTDYRVEGWSCAEQRWVELDEQGWFPTNADNKGSRFHRVFGFHRKNHVVMRALEDFVVAKNNASPEHAAIGGVRFVGLSIPIAKLEGPVPPFERKPLSAYPAKLKSTIHATPESRALATCALQGKEAS
jgi:hypothetical protein